MSSQQAAACSGSRGHWFQELITTALSQHRPEPRLVPVTALRGGSFLNGMEPNQAALAFPSSRGGLSSVSLRALRAGAWLWLTHIAGMCWGGRGEEVGVLPWTETPEALSAGPDSQSSEAEGAQCILASLWLSSRG